MTISDPHIDQGMAHCAPDIDVDSLLEQRIKDWGESEDVAREQLEWFQERATSIAGRKSQAGDAIGTALFDLFAALLTPPVKAPVKYLVKFYLWRCDMPLADAMLNYETPANWYRDMGISKWMCFKLANEFCDFMKLKRRSNQRDDDARKKMSVKRLAKHENKKKIKASGSSINGR